MKKQFCQSHPHRVDYSGYSGGSKRRRGRGSRVGPQGAGFSIEAPGDRTVVSWSQILPVAPRTRVLVERRDRRATALNGPAGSAIMRQLALFEFVALTMAEDPNGPSPGERAWQEKKRALETVFDQRVGAAVPRDDGAHRGDVEAFFSARSSDELNVLFAVVSKATHELESGINLMIFDESDVIQREVESVIARVK